MRLLGITGGIGMGKSTAASFLDAWKVPVIDTDTLAHQAVEPGQPALGEVIEAFGKEIIGPDGRLRRHALAQLIFSDAELRKRLEDILHPRIQHAWQAQVQNWKAEGHPLGVVVIPLLYETNAAQFFDAIVCMACSSATQRQRLAPRGWSPEQLALRIAAQWSVEKKMDLADFVVWTEGSLSAHAKQIERIVTVASATATGR